MNAKKICWPLFLFSTFQGPGTYVFEITFCVHTDRNPNQERRVERAIIKKQVEKSASDESKLKSQVNHQEERRKIQSKKLDLTNVKCWSKISNYECTKEQMGPRSQSSFETRRCSCKNCCWS
jgi:hypothetical protein